MLYKIGVFLSLLCSSVALVPQIAICEYDGCPSVSQMGMGALHLGDSISGLTDARLVNNWIKKALSVGINLFDLSDVYPVKGGDAGDSATLFGEALAMTPGLREKIVIVAKLDIIFPSAIDTTRDHIYSTLDWYFSVLGGTTYVDILLLHYSNSVMNAVEVAETFRDLKASGKVKFFGVSNHYPSKFDLLQAKLDKVTGGDIKLVTSEFEMSVWNPSYMNYNNPLLDSVYAKGIHPLAWSALAGDPVGGLNRLFIRRGDRQTKILRALADVGAEMGIADEALVALVWLLSHPAQVIPLIGTTNSTRILTYATAFDYVGKMTNDQWWTIGGAGGLCPLGDSQCNYSEYMAIN